MIKMSTSVPVLNNDDTAARQAPQPPQSPSPFILPQEIYEMLKPMATHTNEPTESRKHNVFDKEEEKENSATSHPGDLDAVLALMGEKCSLYYDSIAHNEDLSVLEDVLTSMHTQFDTIQERLTAARLEAMKHSERELYEYCAMMKSQEVEIERSKAADTARFSHALTAMHRACKDGEKLLMDAHATRKMAIRDEMLHGIGRFRTLGDALHHDTAAKLATQHVTLMKFADEEYLAYETLWKELSQKMTDLTLELSAAKRDRIVLPHVFQYDCDIMECRVKRKEQTSVDLRRRLVKAETTLNSLRRDHAKGEEASKGEQGWLYADSRKAEDQYHALMKKMRHFDAYDAREMQGLVAMKEQSIKKLVTRLQDACMSICSRTECLTSIDSNINCDSNDIASAIPCPHRSLPVVSLRFSDQKDEEPWEEGYWKSKRNMHVSSELVHGLQELEVRLRRAVFGGGGRRVGGGKKEEET